MKHTELADSSTPVPTKTEAAIRAARLLYDQTQQLRRQVDGMNDRIDNLSSSLKQHQDDIAELINELLP